MKKIGEKKNTEEYVAGAIADLKDFISEKFATKDDLKRFATKDDLKRFATKGDVKAILKEALFDYPTKNDLHEEFQKFAKGDLKEATLQVIEAIEDLDGRTSSQLKDHKKRITTLESAKN